MDNLAQRIDELEKRVDLLQSIICFKVCAGNSEVLNAELKRLMDDEGLYGDWPKEDGTGFTFEPPRHSFTQGG